MMDTIHNFVSCTSEYIRKEYVNHDKVMSLYESSMISKQALEEILPDLERIEHMTDILGQRALMAVTLKWPASSNLNNKPFKERGILKKYLNSWGIEG
ncbi:MAG: hypothetical protein AAF621_05350 [Pseudomonadota bacterium]